MMNSKLIVIKTKRAFLYLFSRINKYLWRIVEKFVVEPVHFVQLEDLQLGQLGEIFLHELVGGAVALGEVVVTAGDPDVGELVYN